MSFFPVPLLPKPSLKTLASIYTASSLFTNSAKDVVGVWSNKTGNQVFVSARAMKVNIMPSSKLMDHPIEDGSLVTDFRIQNPTECELSVICTNKKSAKTVYSEIDTAWKNGDLFNIKTKSGVLMNMMIQAIPHDEVPEMFDVLAVSIKFREVIIAVTSYTALQANQVKNSNSASTAAPAVKAPIPAPASLLSKIVGGVTQSIKTFASGVASHF